MYRPGVAVSLQYQHTWPLRIVGVVFDHDGFRRTCHDVPHDDLIGGKLIVSMLGDLDVTCLDKLKDPFVGLVHAIILSAVRTPGQEHRTMPRRREMGILETAQPIVSWRLFEIVTGHDLTPNPGVRTESSITAPVSWK